MARLFTPLVIRRLLLISLSVSYACADGRALPTGPTAIPQSLPATHFVSGRIVDTNLVAVPDATIISLANNERAVSGYQGEFELRSDAAFTQFTVEREGYETRNFAIERSDNARVDVILQGLVVMDPNAVAALTLSPRDLPRYVAEPYESDYCNPCKLIRLRTTAGSALHLDLAWTDEEALGLWVQGVRASTTNTRHASADVLGTGGELILHVGRPYPSGDAGLRHETAFQLTASQQP